jgi:hypothetical protein
VSNSNKPRRKNVDRDDDGNQGDRGGSDRQRDRDNRDEPQDKLSKAFREILGREPDDNDRQQLFRIMQAMGVQDNDAIYSIALLLYSYEEKIGRIPDQIKQAAQEQQEALKAGAELAANQAQAGINDSVLALLPNIRADIKSVVGRSASTAIKRIELGRGMFSIWSGGLVAAGLIILGILIDSGVYRYVFTHPKQVQAFQTMYGWQIVIALVLPPFLGLGLYAIENDYSSESKFAGWLVILISIVTFMVPGLRIMGWWFWK